MEDKNLDNSNRAATAPEGAPALMARLKAETRADHDGAEATGFMKDLMTGRLAPQVYGQAIAQLGYVRAKLEELFRSLNEDADGQVKAVFKRHHVLSPLYRSDAQHWKTDGDEPLPATQAFMEQLTAWSRSFTPALLGALYVLEGSNMGATIIRKRLREMHNLPENEPGLSSLDPHGAELMNRWRGFAAEMNGLELSDEEKDRIVEAAGRTFSAIGEIHNAVYDANFSAGSASK